MLLDALSGKLTDDATQKAYVFPCRGVVFLGFVDLGSKAFAFDTEFFDFFKKVV